MDTSDRYNFDAPNQEMDFMELHNAPVDDNWFEQLAGGQLRTPLCDDEDLTQTSQEAITFSVHRASGHLSPPPRDHEEHTQTSQEDAAHTDTDGSSSARPSNIVTSWGADTKHTTASSQPRRVSKRKMETAGPPVKKQRTNPVAQLVRKSSQILNNKSTRATRSTSSRQTGSTSSRQTRSTSSRQTRSTELSSEELELERMKELQQEVALHRKKNEASYKAALAGNPPAKKMVLTVTVPKEFNFKTDARMKGSASANVEDQLRKPTSPIKALRSATVPKPFNLSTSRKPKGEESKPYVPIAQQVQMFHKKTPERFHQPSRQVQKRGPSPVTSAHKPTVKKPTVPEDFHLQVEKRLRERQAKKPPAVEEEEEEPPQPFKSHPVPKKILEGVVGVPEKKVTAVTVPESPAFALKKRIRVESAPVEVKPPSAIKAPPVPHFGLPFLPKLSETHQVEMCPFSFDKREQERRALKEKKLEQLRNEEGPKFKAQRLPHFTTVALPEKKRLEPTKPEPFNLQVDARGLEKSSRWDHMIQEEKRQQEEATHFKARPNVVIHKEPFKPKKEERAAMSSSAAAGFQLQTERRAKERQEFDRLVNEKESLSALMGEQRRKEEEAQEKEEITRLRQEQVHKAQPVKHYRTVTVKKSEMPLTVPQSPQFTDRFRM